MTAFLKHDRYAEWPGVRCRSSALSSLPGAYGQVCGSPQGPVFLPVPLLARAAAGDGAGGRERPLKGRSRRHVGPERRRSGPPRALGHPRRTMQDLSTASSICSGESRTRRAYRPGPCTGRSRVASGHTGHRSHSNRGIEGPDSTMCGSLLPGTLPKGRTGCRTHTPRLAQHAG